VQGSLGTTGGFQQLIFKIARRPRVVRRKLARSHPGGGLAQGRHGSRARGGRRHGAQTPTADPTRPFQNQSCRKMGSPTSICSRVRSARAGCRWSNVDSNHPAGPNLAFGLHSMISLSFWDGPYRGPRQAEAQEEVPQQNPERLRIPPNLKGPQQLGTGDTLVAHGGRLRDIIRFEGRAPGSGSWFFFFGRIYKRVIWLGTIKGPGSARHVLQARPTADMDRVLGKRRLSERIRLRGWGVTILGSTFQQKRGAGKIRRSSFFPILRHAGI